MRTLDPAEFAPGSDRRDVLERCLEVVSEASRSLPVEARAAYPDVNWRGLADLGNVLRHGYDHVSARQLLDVLADHLDPLERAVQTILSDIDRS